MDKQIFIKDKHSVQKNLFFNGLQYNMTSSIPNTIGITQVPDTIFHMSDKQQVMPAEAICMLLSDSKYLGHSPTMPRATTDRNGRN